MIRRKPKIFIGNPKGLKPFVELLGYWSNSWSHFDEKKTTPNKKVIIEFQNEENMKTTKNIMFNEYYIREDWFPGVIPFEFSANGGNGKYTRDNVLIMLR